MELVGNYVPSKVRPAGNMRQVVDGSMKKLVVRKRKKRELKSWCLLVPHLFCSIVRNHLSLPLYSIQKKRFLKLRAPKQVVSYALLSASSDNAQSKPPSRQTTFLIGNQYQSYLFISFVCQREDDPQTPQNWVDSCSADKTFVCGILNKATF